MDMNDLISGIPPQTPVWVVVSAFLAAIGYKVIRIVKGDVAADKRDERADKIAADLNRMWLEERARADKMAGERNAAIVREAEAKAALARRDIELSEARAEIERLRRLSDLGS